jgi:hypothetical protein
MPRIRDILVHVSVEPAVKKRKCHRSGGKHGVRAGAMCLVVREGLGRKNYCHECAPPILALAGRRLNDLREALSGKGVAPQANG